MTPELQKLLQNHAARLRTADALLPHNVDTLANTLTHLAPHLQPQHPHPPHPPTTPQPENDTVAADSRDTTGPRALPYRRPAPAATPDNLPHHLHNTPHALPPRALHEWTLDLGSIDPHANHRQHDWMAPLIVLASLAATRLETLPPHQQSLVWIGRKCWPTLHLLQSLLAQNPHDRDWTSRMIFLDPLTDEQRTWCIEQALQCPGIGAVVADAANLPSAATRRLQLAAESQPAGPLALLARPPWEINTPTWAATRWRVAPCIAEPTHVQAMEKGPDPRDGVANLEAQPRWTVELLRCKGQQIAGLGATRRWTVHLEVNRGKGSLCFSAPLGHPAAGLPQNTRRTA